MNHELLIWNAIAWATLAIAIIFYAWLRSHGPVPKKEPWGAIYDQLNGYLHAFWNKIPYRGQSVAIILTWVFIPVLMWYSLSVKQLTLSDLPWIGLTIFCSFLSIFYIVTELKGELRKKVTIYYPTRDESESHRGKGEHVYYEAGKGWYVK